MKTNSIEKSFTIEKILKIDFQKIFIFHERDQKVYHEYLFVVYTKKLSWNTYFMKCSERNISQRILVLRNYKLQCQEDYRETVNFKPGHKELCSTVQSN